MDARQAALTGLFDDAALLGVDPPPLGEAVAAFRGHLSGDRAWLVRHLLVPASRAGEVLPLLEDDDSLPLAIVLDRTAEGSFGESLAADLVGIGPLVRDPRVRLGGLEVALDGGEPDGEVAALMAGLQGARIPAEVVVSVEVPVADRAPGRVVRHLTALAAVRQAGGADRDRVVASVRCSGTTAGDVPDDLNLAGFLMACAREDVPVGSVSGAPAPTRRTDPDHGGQVHGILNLLAACTAAQRAEGLEAIRTHLGRPGEAFKLGSGALVVDTEVIEGDVVAAMRAGLLRGVAVTDLMEVVTQLAQRGVVTPTGGTP